MFAVPKDTQMLIFHFPIDGGLCKEQINKIEAELTERTGLPCIVYDDVIYGSDEDFKVRYIHREYVLKLESRVKELTEQLQNHAGQATKMLNQHGEQECDDGHNDLPTQTAVLRSHQLILCFRESVLRFGKLVLYFCQFFLTGLGAFTLGAILFRLLGS